MRITIEVYDDKATCIGLGKNTVRYITGNNVCGKNHTSYEDAATIGMLSADILSDAGHDVVLRYMW